MNVPQNLNELGKEFEKFGFSLSSIAYAEGKLKFELIPLTKIEEKIKLTPGEMMVGWRGPSGFRIQQYKSKTVDCVVCGQKISSGISLARWRTKVPEKGDQDINCGKPCQEENHSHAHVECLYKHRDLVRNRGCGLGMTSSAKAVNEKLKNLSYSPSDVPEWLWAKRHKYASQGAEK